MKVFAPIQAVAVAACAIFATAGASANPTGAMVVNGVVTINQSGNLLSITNSPNSIINWQAFSIGASEITRFTQQSATSAVLNRVVGAGGAIDPSVILGALQSNGRVFLINPSGIVFGAGAQIDVAGLVASSLNLSNADFLDGRLRFTEVPGAGSVVNQGAINAASGGQVYLIGPAVTNSGVITSPQGEVILAAGKSVELVNPATPSLRVEITAPDNEAKNLGSIIAQSGRIGIYAGLIKSSGTLNADRAVTGPSGEILLKATTDVSIQGTVTAIGGPVSIEAGGSIAIGDGTQTGTIRGHEISINASGGFSMEGGSVVEGTGDITLTGPLCPASTGSACGSLPPQPPLVIGGSPGQGVVLIGQQGASGNITVVSGATTPGGSISIGQGGTTLTQDTTQGGTLTLVAGSGITTQGGTVTVVSGSGAITTQGGSVTLAPVNGTLTVNNTAVPLSALPGTGSVNLLTQLPVVQTSSRGTAQVMGGITTISQVNGLMNNLGGTAPQTLTPPRTSLTFE